MPDIGMSQTAIRFVGVLFLVVLGHSLKWKLGQRILLIGGVLLLLEATRR